MACLLSGCFAEPDPLASGTSSSTSTSDDATTDAPATSAGSSTGPSTTDQSTSDSTAFVDSDSGFNETSTGLAPDQWDPALLWLTRIEGGIGNAERADALFVDAETGDVWVAATSAADAPQGHISLLALSSNGMITREFSSVQAGLLSSSSRDLSPIRGNEQLAGFVVAGVGDVNGEGDRLALQFDLQTESFTNLGLETSPGIDVVNAVIEQGGNRFYGGTVSSAGIRNGWVARRGASVQTWDHVIASPDVDAEVTGIMRDGPGLVVTGYRGSAKDGAATAFVRQVTDVGDLGWDLEIDIEGPSQSLAITRGPDGGSFVAGTFAGQELNAWIAYVDAMGTQVWTRQFSAGAGEELPFAITASQDGVFVCGSNMARDSAVQQGWLAKLTLDGQLQGEHTLSTKSGGNDRVLDCVTTDGLLYIAGWTEGASGERDGFVAALSTE